MVADALTHKDITDLRAIFADLSLFDDDSLLAKLQVKPVWIEQIKSKQLEDKSLGHRICVPKDTDLRQTLLQEAHSSPYAMHLGGNKMHKDFRELYWWTGLKREVTDFVGKCLTCQQVEAELQLPSGLLQPMAPYEALYCHKYRTPSCWTELGERHVLGLKLVSDTEDKIRLIWDRLKVASDRQKSYADLKLKEIEYSVGDFVFLNILPWKKVLRFGHKRKLSPRFIKPYCIVFHVSMLRRYRSEPTHVVPVEEIEVRPDLTFEEELVQILD
ncbi:uncharacterized protein LOC108468521 [Gossypium arboreum]|uniref:uncharacterized protein LOC108468521 n=1 Tax=Gossypium arboreum TaxID=29729 RepID=UPI0008196D98|nr:uncharacterized protein LOC108468521 [Gossypium arboreum]